MKKKKGIQLLTVFVLLVFLFVQNSVFVETNAASETKITFTNLPGNSYTLKKGETFQLKTKLIPDSETKQELTWKSSDKNIVKVTSTGKITGVSAGKATITISSKDKKIKAVKCYMTVGTPVKSIKIGNAKLEMKVGDQRSLKASVLPAEASNKGIIYQSSNNKVATVNKQGAVTATGTGQTVITALSADGRTSSKAEIKVADIRILTKKDSKNGKIQISNINHDNVIVDSSVGNTPIILNHVSIKESLSLPNNLHTDITIIDSKIKTILVNETIADTKLFSLEKETAANILLTGSSAISTVYVGGNLILSGDAVIEQIWVTKRSVLDLHAPAKTVTVNKEARGTDISIANKVDILKIIGDGADINIKGTAEEIVSIGSGINIFVDAKAVAASIDTSGVNTKISGKGKIETITIHGDNTSIDVKGVKIVVDPSVKGTELPRQGTSSESASTGNSSGGSSSGGSSSESENPFIQSIEMTVPGKMTVTFNKATEKELTKNSFSIICNGGANMTILSAVTRQDGNYKKVYDLSISFIKDNSYDLFVTLPNGTIISKSFVSQFNCPTASNVKTVRAEKTLGRLQLFDVDEGGFIYTLLIPNSDQKARTVQNISVKNGVTAERIKAEGRKDTLQSGYFELEFPSLTEGQVYQVYYLMEAFDGRTSSVHGPLSIHSEVTQDGSSSDISIVYVAEEKTNHFVIKLDKILNEVLTLDNFKIICPTDSNLTLQEATLSIDSSGLVYTIDIPENYGHKDNAYILVITFADRSQAKKEFRVHFKPPLIMGVVSKRVSENKVILSFNSDEAGVVYFGTFTSNNSVNAGSSNTPMADDIINGGYPSKELFIGLNEIEVDITDVMADEKARILIVPIDLAGNYMKGFVQYYSFPADIEIPEVPDSDQIQMEVTKAVSEDLRTIIHVTFTDSVASFNQQNIVIQTIKDGGLPGQLLLGVSRYSEKEAEITVMNGALKPGTYKLKITVTPDKTGKPVEVSKEFVIL